MRRPPTDDERCKGRKTSGDPCPNYRMRGGLVCHVHGGRAPQVRAKAAQRVVEEKIRRTLAGTGAPAVENPFTELARLAGQAVAWKDTLAGIVDHLSGRAECPHCGGEVVGVSGEWRYEASGAGTEQLRSELSLFERALDRCAAMLGMIAKLNIDERMARISEKQAAALVRALDAGLAHAGVTGAVAAESRAVAARELRSVS